MNIPAETLLVVATALLIAGSAALCSLIDRATSAWREHRRDRDELSYAVENHGGTVHAANQMRYARRSRKRAMIATAWPLSFALALVATLIVLAAAGGLS